MNLVSIHEFGYLIFLEKKMKYSIDWARLVLPDVIKLENKLNFEICFCVFIWFTLEKFLP